jgi:hypothetical protein
MFKGRVFEIPFLPGQGMPFLDQKSRRIAQRVRRSGRVGKSKLLVVRFAHSHSAIQFLPHFPWHWYSNILPPHCGQTKLIIEEMMLALDSPGIASMTLMLSSLALAFCKRDANYQS